MEFVDTVNALYPQWVVITISILFGLLFGSFTNVLIARVPDRVTLLTRSACPKCGHQIRNRDNIPIFSWLLLRGKCRDCGNKISVEYPLVELGVAIGFAFFTWATGSLFFPEPIVMAGYGLIVVTAALSVIDAKTKTLPNPLVLAFTIIAILGVISQTIFILLTSDNNITSIIITSISFAAFFGLFYFALWFFSGGRGVGFGDVKLAPAIGLYAGYFSISAAIVGFLSAFIISGIPLAILMLTKVVKKGQQVPFGPFLLGGMWIGIIMGSEIVSLYESIAF